MSYVLTPGRENTGEDLDLSRPYKGKMYVDREVDIEYGTSQAVSAETIRQFLSDHRSEIVDGGYQIDALLKN